MIVSMQRISKEFKNDLAVCNSRLMIVTGHMQRYLNVHSTALKIVNALDKAP